MKQEDEHEQESNGSFADLALPPPILKAIESLGYGQPTPIQTKAIPFLIEGNDIIGQAQTGTGKTAAFALPLLGQLSLDKKVPQLLVIAPTRELALQVSESMKSYGRYLKGLKVLPVYGGQGMTTQLRALKQGVHVVVGTPGRLIDHLKRGTLKLDNINALVLDEADEMLRMGFIEDVETIMETMPDERLTALFSATMPPPIARIAKRFLRKPQQVRTKSKETTVESVTQYYITVSGARKLEALSRLVEVEAFDGMIVFTKTRLSTTDVVERLGQRGIDAVALNGDMNQNARQYTIDRFKAGGVDILVCTDVAARGLDVPRVSHVVNYDIPYDTEAYVHRIGRTGRAGREGTAITFVARNDTRMLQSIQRATRKTMEKRSVPTAKALARKRIGDFKERVIDTLASEKLERFAKIVDELSEEAALDPRMVAAALIYQAQEDRPFMVKDSYIEDKERPRQERAERTQDRSRGQRRDRGRQAPPEYATSGDPKKRRMAVYRVGVGSDHGLEARNLVGAISNETGIPAKAIGGIRIAKHDSLVELPANMPTELLKSMKKIWVCGQQLNITHEVDGPDRTTRHHRNQEHRTRNASKQSPSRKSRNERRSSAHRKKSGSEENANRGRKPNKPSR